MAIRNRENVQRPLLGLRGFDEEEPPDEDAASRRMARVRDAVRARCSSSASAGRRRPPEPQAARPSGLRGPRHEQDSSQANLILLGILVVQLIVIVLLPKRGRGVGRAKRGRRGGRGPAALRVDRHAAARARVTITSRRRQGREARGRRPRRRATRTSSAGCSRTATGSRRARPTSTRSSTRRGRSGSRASSARQEKRYARLNVADGVMHARVAGRRRGRQDASRISASARARTSARCTSASRAIRPSTRRPAFRPGSSRRRVSGLVENVVPRPADGPGREGEAHVRRRDVRRREGDAREPARVAARRAQPRAAPASRGPETKPEPKRAALDPATRTSPLDKTKVESWIRGLARINLGEPDRQGEEARVRLRQADRHGDAHAWPTARK